MLSCAFFGHRSYDYRPYKDKIREVVEYLINKGVTEFYNGWRGRFDVICAQIVSELKEKYPQIKNIMVLSYRPTKEFELPKYFDESIYLLEDSVPPRYAIARTNRALVKKVNYVVSGVAYVWGGAFNACEYAKKLLRSMVNVVTGKSQYFYEFMSDDEIAKLIEEYKEEADALYLRIKDEVETSIVEHAKKRNKK